MNRYVKIIIGVVIASVFVLLAIGLLYRPSGKYVVVDKYIAPRSNDHVVVIKHIESGIYYKDYMVTISEYYTRSIGDTIVK